MARLKDSSSFDCHHGCMHIHMLKPNPEKLLCGKTACMSPIPQSTKSQAMKQWQPHHSCVADSACPSRILANAQQFITHDNTLPGCQSLANQTARSNLQITSPCKGQASQHIASCSKAVSFVQAATHHSLHFAAVQRVAEVPFIWMGVLSNKLLPSTSTVGPS